MKMQYWLHRISYLGNISRPLLRDYGFLSIGFSDFLEEENFVDNLLQKDVKYLDETTKRLWGNKARIRHNLSRFIKMKKGDWVIVPDHGVFSIYEIDDEKAVPISILENILKEEFSKKKLKIINGKLYKETEGNKDRLIDLGFVRKVKKVHIGISRKKYADAKLTRRLKFQGTNAEISDLAESIQESVKLFLEKRPINLYAQIEQIFLGDVLNTIRAKLNPDKWEKLIKIYFEKCGADSVVIPPKNQRNKSGDADSVAVFEKIKTIIYVQAKFHGQETRPQKAIKQVHEFVNNLEAQESDEEYTRIKWVITSADSYSPHDEDQILDKGITLITGREFTRMLFDVGISDLEKI